MALSAEAQTKVSQRWTVTQKQCATQPPDPGRSQASAGTHLFKNKRTRQTQKGITKNALLYCTKVLALSGALEEEEEESGDSCTHTDAATQDAGWKQPLTGS